MDFSDTLRKLKNNDISLDEAEKRLRINNFEVLSNIAKVDVHRTKRTGIPEAIIADGKTCEIRKHCATHMVQAFPVIMEYPVTT